MPRKWFAEKELAHERRGQLIDRVAERITRRGLAAPAVLLLELFKPFSFIASQGLLLCQPLSSWMNVERQVADYAALLADRSNVDYLVARLEQGTRREESG
ncbi:MAG: hypothetical protein JXM73_03930 [Anaerolineae bacterium]|nr:hypothetical protein [Anaerolineae bacterium]